MSTIAICDLFVNSVTRLISRRKQIAAHLERLQAAGLTAKKPSLYKRRYLYMIGPPGPDQKRSRIYVGRSAEKQAQALAPYFRTLECEAWQRKFDRINELLARAEAISSEFSTSIEHAIEVEGLDQAADIDQITAPLRSFLAKPHKPQS